MKLGNIKRIESAILCAPVKEAKRFYEVIFGLDEGRLSRKKLKEFEGFKLNDVDLCIKVEELKDTFSLWELKSVANLLGIQLSCRQDVASELCKFLNDISLLFEATNEEQLDEEEDEYFEEVSGNSTSSKYVQQCRPCQFSSRDIEESLRPFTGEDNYTVNLWLTDFEELAQVMKWIESAILCAPVKEAKRFYEVIFGLDEGRLSRKKLKEFEGFKLNDVDLCIKVEELKDTFSLWELKSVANLLGIQLSCRQDVASELCKFLNDISLLFEATNEEQLDEEEDEYFEEVSGNSTSSKYVQQCRPCQFSSRDIEESLRPFTGEDNYTVNLWLTDFEELAQVMKWQELEKLVFAKISLKGLAKLFVYGERGLTSYSALKEALVEEFSNEDSVKENCLRLNKIDSKVASRKCFNCYEEGHLVAECPKPRREKGSCFQCGKMGHIQRDCQRQKQSTTSLVSLVAEKSALPPYTSDIVIEGATTSGEVEALPGSAISLIMEDRVSENDILREVALNDGSELILIDHSAVEQKPFTIVNPELTVNYVKSVPKIISECIPTEKPSKPTVEIKVIPELNLSMLQENDKRNCEISEYLENKEEEKLYDSAGVFFE
uniref:CCHC-type domain-containing protein n=1 Tax=Rhodnius prolixus TaxID=13249 RepID=T1HI32_RHOPR